MNLSVTKAVLILLMCTKTIAIVAEENGRMLNYIETYKHLAIQEMHRTQIPASIKLAQAILESQAGSSLLAVKANNHFGIKCGDKWSGATYYLRDDDYDKNGNHIQSCFRVYQDALESFVAHSGFITGEGRTTNRYASLFLLPRDDYKAWAEGLQKAGYATHPMYARRLVSIIENYKLHQFDQKNSNRAPAAPAGFFMDYKSPFTKVNGLKSVYVDYMASPAEISMDFNIPVDQIMQYNELLQDKNAPIYTPMNVFLEKKKKKSSQGLTYHTVKPGETIESISQEYGIQAKYLYRRNRIEKGNQPATGTKIYLNRKSKYAAAVANSQESLNIESALSTTEIPQPNTPKEPTENQKTIQYVRTSQEPTIEKIESDQETYIVKEKDTLFSIARKLGITVQAIKSLNQLQTDSIQIGQELKIK
jgi:LysM repeat protein